MPLQEKLMESFDGCRICMGLYKNPKILQCLHSFCAECLEKRLDDSDSSNVITCPICERPTMLRFRGILGLTTNTFIIRKQYLRGLHLQVQARNSTGIDSDEPADTSSDVETSIDGTDVTVTRGDREAESSPVDQDDFVFSRSQRNEADYYRVNPPSPTSTKFGNYFDFSCSTYKAKEPLRVRHIRSELEGNAMNLRSEVLAITDAIDVINQYVKGWKSRKEDFRSKIMQRSYQLQKMVQEEERMMLEQLENITDENNFLQEAELKKQDLHSSLKASLQAVAFSRQILCEGTPEEILELGDILNQRLKQNIHSDVYMNIPQFSLETPANNASDLISQAFGEVFRRISEKPVYSSRKMATYTLEDNDFDDDVTIIETDSFLVSNKDFSRVKVDPNAKHSSLHGNQSNRKSPKRPDSIDIKPIQALTNENLALNGEEIKDESTLNRFMNLRTSLREKRSKILRAHSDTTSPTSPYESSAERTPTAITRTMWGSQEELTKLRPRPRMRRHHTFSTPSRTAYEQSKGEPGGPNQDSLVSPTIPETPEEQTNGIHEVNGDGSSTGNSMVNATLVRENIRRRKGSWRSLTLS